MRLTLALVPFLAGVALAGKPGLNNLLCSVVKGLVTAAHEQGPATKFCSSYLHLTETTVTSTKTPTTVTTVTITATNAPITSSRTETSTVTSTATRFTISVATNTVTKIATSIATNVVTNTLTELATATQTNTITNIVTSVTGLTVTSIATATVTAGGTVTTTVTSGLNSCGSRDPTKRRRAIAAKPSFLSRYSIGAQLSSACSCLDIQKCTSTTTKTAPMSTRTSTVTQTTVATITSKKTTTVTSTVSLTLTTAVTTQVTTQITTAASTAVTTAITTDITITASTDVSLTGTTIITTTDTVTISTLVTVTSQATATATAVSPFHIIPADNGNAPDFNSGLICPFSRPAQEYLCNFASGAPLGDDFILRPDGRISALERVPNTDFNFLGISGFSGNYRNYITADANSFNGDPQMHCEILPGASGACPMSCTLSDLYGNTDQASSLCAGGLWWIEQGTKDGCSPLTAYAVPAQ